MKTQKHCSILKKSTEQLLKMNPFSVKFFDSGGGRVIRFEEEFLRTILVQKRLRIVLVSLGCPAYQRQRAKVYDQ